ncbi:hypothetical protein [Burkholderia cepacia]|uniref:hypothetical protein n=1 Tax=Burkholderia cepacia TaxID=292 RepID=UPI00158BEE07|nr:hypothetical protein [Burkholderia cepacia]MCA8059211.1 hypothetical protein [Burkholderia cepacia]MCA8136721.1 hypothetical protein [Burkholderia cepacia]MCA8162237.1 hypothetical protein [Burkholderia cepacia]HEM7889507.1 hypothetical protein [Burkholderia cepacia]HEM8510024.1 hypothetical protein [Burkholderia cepacia]
MSKAWRASVSFGLVGYLFRDANRPARFLAIQERCRGGALMAIKPDGSGRSALDGARRAGASPD